MEEASQVPVLITDPSRPDNNIDSIDQLLKRLWLVNRSQNAAHFEEVECELMDAIRIHPTAAHSSYSAFFHDEAQLLWHLCANGCSFELIAHVHFQNEQACRQRKSLLQGSYPIHMACKAGCDVKTINFLAKQFPEVLLREDDEVNYPLHVALLHHSHPAALVPILHPRMDNLVDLTMSFPDDSFPVDVLDALMLLRSNNKQSIALETNPTNRESEHVIFDSSRGHGFCPEMTESMRITIGLQHLEGTIMALASQRRLVTSLNVKFFEELPVQAMAKLDTLRYLFLQKGEISHDDFAALLQTLAKKPHFSKLHLRSSTSLCGCSPIQLLALTKLETLDLGHNSIGPSLASPLAALLVATDSLKHLDIGGNDIGVDGMQEICQALGQNKTVLSFCMVGEASVIELVHTLQEHNTTIQSIRLGLAGMSIHDAVEYWLQANRCGRRKLLEDGGTKEDLLLSLAAVNCRSIQNKVGAYYALLLTNPALWCTPHYLET